MDDVGKTIVHVAGVDAASREYRIERRRRNKPGIIFVCAIILRRQIRQDVGEIFFDVSSFVLAVNVAQHVYDRGLVFLRHFPYLWTTRRISSLVRVSDVKDVSQVRSTTPVIDERNSFRTFFHPPPKGFVPQR
jgi:hypothetical protein